MNESRLRPLLSLLLALLLGACSVASEPDAPPLAGARIGGDFSLVDQDGERISSNQFEGRYRLVYFGFTYCPDVCPVDLAALAAGLRAFEKKDPARAEKVQPIFISVDPERDTPEAMKQYVANFPPRLIGLTGTPDEIAAVAKAYGVYFAKRGEPGSKDYLVDHSRVATLFGPKGEPIAIIPHDEGAEAVAAELDRWVK